MSVCFAQAVFAQNNVGINTNNPDASAALDVTSTSQGMLVPRMSQAQRGFINLVNGVSTPATGLLIYQTDNTPGFYFYSGATWTPLNGTNGQGVPTGGTTGQVLTKVDGTNYNIQWSTPASGGTTLPSQSGNSGRYLKTDGTSLSWASAPTPFYPNIELNVVPSFGQSFSGLMGTNSYSQVNFSTSNNSNASLTGGNSWNGNTFIVGSSGAGWYQINAQIMTATATTNAPTTIGVHTFLDKNNASGNTPPVYNSGTYTTPYPPAVSTYDLSTNSSFLKNGARLNTIIYLAAGDQITLRAQSLSNNVASQPTTIDGSTSLTIVRLK